MKQTESGVCPVAVVVSLISPSAAWWGYVENHATAIYMCRPRVNFIPAGAVKPSSNPREIAVIEYRNVPRIYTGPRVGAWKWKYDKRAGLHAHKTGRVDILLG